MRFEKAAMKGAAKRQIRGMFGRYLSPAVISQLEEKLVVKNEVISELMEANVLAKKASGEL